MRDVNVLLLFGIVLGVGLGVVGFNLLIEYGGMVASPQVQLAAVPLVMIGAIFASQAKRRIRLSQTKS